MSHAKRAAKRRKGPAVVAVAVGVALVGGLAVVLGQIDLRTGSQEVLPTVTASQNSRDGGPGASGSVEPSASPNSSPSPTAVTAKPTRAASTPVTPAPGAARVSNSAAVVAACSREVAAGEAVVRAAGTAAAGWRAHLQARTDLLAGKITREASGQIWARTKKAGPAQVANLSAAMTAQGKARGLCAKVTGSAGSSCKQRLAALDVASSAGRAAVSDWDHHLKMMAAHAAGAFGSQHAQDLWVAAWKGGPKNLERFALAQAALAGAPRCRPS